MTKLRSAAVLAILLLSATAGDIAAQPANPSSETGAAGLPPCSSERVTMCREVIPGAAPDAVVLGRDLDGDGDADEITIRLEVDEIQEQVYPGKFVTFWVFAPPGDGMVSPARAQPHDPRRGGRSRQTRPREHALLSAHDPPSRHDPPQRHGRRAGHHPSGGDAR
jgi:hypothetical protein